MNLLICVPTYNEAENIEPLIVAIFGCLSPTRSTRTNSTDDNFSVLVIDDNSPDGTAAIVDGLIGKYPGRLHVLKRPGKQGLGKAYIAGFEWGLAEGYDVFLEMDADFSHNPKYIPEMTNLIRDNDAVIGSRNIKGGDVEGRSFMRNFISKGGSLYSRLILGCPVKDLTGGFNMWTKETLLKIGLDNVLSKGYSFRAELKYRAWRAGCSIKEMPITFTDRTLGVSKMSKKIFVEALVNVWKIRWKADASAGQFVRFAVTGGLGSVTNLTVFFVCADLFGLPEIPVSVACFIIATTQNYAINHRWSFRSNMAGEGLSLKRWAAYLAGSLLGLSVNIAVMQAILIHLVLPYKFIAQAFGIVAGMMVNFMLAKYMVFRKRKNNEKNV